MPTECNPSLFELARVEARAVVAGFDGGRITSDAGALLLGATDRVLGLTRRIAACFRDSRDPAYSEHTVDTLVMQRIVASRWGYEDLNDHDPLRHDPVLAVLADKLAASEAVREGSDEREAVEHEADRGDVDQRLRGLHLILVILAQPPVTCSRPQSSTGLLALNLVTRDRSGRASRRGRRKMAAWNDNYMLQIIANQAHA